MLPIRIRNEILTNTRLRIRDGSSRIVAGLVLGVCIVLVPPSARAGGAALSAAVTYVPPLAAIPTGQGTVWYVDAVHGNDRNDGLSIQRPFKTIGSIVNDDGANFRKLHRGDVVVVRAGTYMETIKLQTGGIAGGGPTAPGTPFAGTYTTLMAYPGDARPVIIGSGTLANGTRIPESCPACSAINIWAPFIRVSGFDVSAPYPLVMGGISYYGGGIDAASLLGANNTITQRAHHVIIDNNIAHDSGCGGIGAISDGDYAIIENNLAYNNGYLSPDQCSGISINWSLNTNVNENPTSYHMEVLFNTSYNNQNKVNSDDVSCACHTDGNGIILDANSSLTSDHPVAYNGKILVFGNVAYDNGGRGIHVFTTSNADLVNNTTYHNGKDAQVGSSDEIGVEKAQNVRIINNILYGLGAPETWLVGTTDSSGVIWQNNLMLNGAFGFLRDTNTSLPDRMDLFGLDPRFVSVPRAASPGDSDAVIAAKDRVADFHLQATSPALHQGIPLGFQIFGLTSTAPVNLGAYLK